MKREDKEIRLLCIWRKGVQRFKEDDYHILSRAFTVTRLLFEYSPLCVLKMFFLVRKHDVAYAWFGNIWAFFMVVFGKVWGTRTVIVAGGHDVANVPEINYGLSRHPVLKYFARYALKNADLVLSISEFNQRDLHNFVTPKRNELVYCGCRDVLKGEDVIRKNQVVTAGLIDHMSSVRKGHFEFIEVARHLPNTRFLHVGTAKDGTLEELRSKAPANVEYLGYLPDAEYTRLFLESKVYLQLSRHEAFGVSVVEAMACGCTPVVSNGGCLPEIVGPAGVVMDTRDPEQIAGKIRWVFEYRDDNLEAVKRASEFSLERRAGRLIPLIRDLVTKP